GAEADMNNLDTTIQVSPIPTIRIHKDHPLDQVIGDLQSATQTRNMLKNLKEHRNKKDERGIVIRNKARLVAQGYTQEEGIDYDEVFGPVARIEAIRLFLAYASFKDFVVYQMDVKSAFLYEKIKEEVYVCQPPRFEDPDFPDRVYKVEKVLYGLHQALRSWPLLKDEDGEEVDVHMYRYQVNPKVSHLHAVKRIFRYLKGQPKLGLWYSKDSPFDLVAYTDSDYAGASLDRKSTTGATNQKFNFSKYIFESMVKNLDNAGKFLMYPRFVQVFLDKQLERMSNDNRIYVTPSHTKKIFGNIRRVGKGFSGRDTPLFQTMVVQAQAEMGEDNVADEAINEEMDDSLERAATTATSLDVEQDRGNINKTQSKATPNEAGSQGTTSGGGPRCQETMGDTIAQTRFENVSKTSNDPLLARGNTLQSGEDSLKLNELMKLCTNLQQRVLDLETTKTTQANEIASLKRRVKKLERRNKSRTHRPKRLYRVGSSKRVESSEDKGLGEEDTSKQGRIVDIDANKDSYLVNVHTNEDMFGVNDLYGDEVIVDNVDVVKTAKETVNVAATTVSTASTIPVSAATTAKITNVEVTLGQALAELKSAKPKANKVVIQEPKQGTTTITPTT
ncbi:ribonuclease H-like domain-containing protein, partial [Tanacetum coccineum]